MPTDVAEGAEVAAAVARTVAEFGGIDIVSNNAGIQRYGTVETTSESEWDEVINVNLKSVYLVCHHAIPHLKARRGAIVNMASVQSFATQKGVAAYTTGKHALIGLTRSMALDFAAYGVRVNAVAPGSVDTPMLDWAISLDENPEALMKTVRAMHPLGRIADAAGGGRSRRISRLGRGVFRHRRDARRRRRPVAAAQRRARGRKLGQLQ